MAWVQWGAALALSLGWWSGGHRAGRGLHEGAFGLAAVVGGLLLGAVLGLWLPRPGGALLGAGLLGYLGLFHLACAGGVITRRYIEEDGLTPQTLVEATGLGLLGLAGTTTFVLLVAAVGIGRFTAVYVLPDWRSGRRARLLAGAVLCVLSVLTFRGVS